MKIYITRHAQDDDSVRGGWSENSLTDLGVLESNSLADELSKNQNSYDIGKIYSSDLLRARQTAEIISDKLSVGVEYISGFREVNNGALAGMDNLLADEKYPHFEQRNLLPHRHIGVNWTGTNIIQTAKARKNFMNEYVTLGQNL